MQFATTRWSVILTAKRGSADSRLAMEQLCSAYWYPLYAFVRHNGFSREEAEDITQAFFARFVEKDLLAAVAPESGRFRSFLLVCLKRFISNWREGAAALKRGGGMPAISIDAEDGERRYRCEPAHGMTAERIYERRWALTVLQRALAVVSEEMSRAGKAQLFDELKVYLAGESAAPPFSEVALKLGITESAARAAAFRLRQRYRLAVEHEIAATLSDEADLDEELNSLLAAVSK